MCAHSRCDDMQKEQQVPCSSELIGALTLSLSHALRTPLSIISNEVQYLSTVLPPGECERVLSRCRELDRMLRRYARISRSVLQFEDVALGDVLEASGATHERIRTDRTRLAEFLGLVPELFSALRERLSESVTVPHSSSMLAPTRTVVGTRVSWQGEVPEASVLKPGGHRDETYKSLHRLCLALWGAEIAEAIFLDALASSLRCDLDAHLRGNELAISVCVDSERDY